MIYLVLGSFFYFNVMTLEGRDTHPLNLINTGDLVFI